MILPRGYADRLYNLIPETATSVKWDKEQVEGEPVDFGPWNENFQIRDYQHPLIDSLLRKMVSGFPRLVPVKLSWVCDISMKLDARPYGFTHTRGFSISDQGQGVIYTERCRPCRYPGDGIEDFGDRKLIIATVQTLKAKQRLVEKLKEFIGVVVIDEAQPLPVPSF